MPAASEADVRRQLQRGTIAPVYLLVGDDEVGKTPLVDALTALVEPDVRAFNFQRFYAGETSLADIMASVRTVPLLGGRRVVLVLRAELLLKPKVRGQARDADDEGEPAEPPGPREPAADDLEAYLESPAPETSLVFVAADVNRSVRLTKAVVGYAVVVEYWGLKGDREVRGRRGIVQVADRADAYVRDRIAEAGKKISREAMAPLTQHAGADIAALRGAVEHVLTYVGTRPMITAGDVRAVVRGEVSVDPWAVTNAVEEGDAATALRELALSLDGGASPFQVLGQLGWFVRSRLPTYAPGRVHEATDAVLRTDLALKSSGGDPQILLERLVVELCGRAPTGTGPRPSGRR